MNTRRPLFCVLRPSVLAFALAIGLAAPSSLQAADRYFDQNGTVSGFGLDQNALSYSWDLTSAVWNSNRHGEGAGPLATWTDGDFAQFFLSVEEVTDTTSGPFNLKLMQSVSVAGLSAEIKRGWSDLLIDAAAPSEEGSYTSITFASGASVGVAMPSGNRSIIFGNNIELKGDFKVVGGGYGRVQIAGSGPAYNGTITINAGTGAPANIRETGFYIDKTATEPSLLSRVSDEAKFVIHDGSLLIKTGDAGATIAELSGTGGVIYGFSGSVLNVKQSADTTWAGQLGEPENVNSKHFGVRKQGPGRLSLTGSMHYMTAAASVEEGALYVNGNIDDDVQAVGRVDLAVSGGATLGGGMTTNKRLVLSASNSVLNPGAYGEAGAMSLSNGLVTANGGTLSFNLGGVDGEGNAVVSRIDVIGGTLALSGTMTINLHDLGKAPLRADQSYTLVDFSSDNVTLKLGEGLNWVLGDVPAGFKVASFGVADGRLQVKFSRVPKPSAKVESEDASATVVLDR
jgi:hypothetical protein